MSRRAYDYIFAGAGITGLCLALKIKREQPAAKILLLEKEGSLGQHASGRNSGVLHAGIYYPPETLKAKLCVNGHRQMLAFCNEHDIKTVKAGKIILPRNDAELAILERLYHYGTTNGAELYMVDAIETKKIEPSANAFLNRALYSPLTTVTDPKSVLKKISDLLKGQGVEIAFGHCVTHVDPSGKEVVTQKERFSFGRFINAAGGHADKLARCFNVGADYLFIPFRGSYYKLSPASAVRINGNIYPVPNPAVPFLGVHFTRSVAGDVYIGPCATPVWGRENYRRLRGVHVGEALVNALFLSRMALFNTQGIRSLVKQEVRHMFRSGFFHSAKGLVEGLKPTDLITSEKAGIRPQLVKRSTGTLEMDFVVEKAENSVHILNAISPAFTCGFSFADYTYDTYLA